MREYEVAMGESLIVGGTSIDPTLLVETNSFMLDAAKQQLIMKEWFYFFESVYKGKASYNKHATNTNVFNPPSLNNR